MAPLPAKDRMRKMREKQNDMKKQEEKDSARLRMKRLRDQRKNYKAYQKEASKLRMRKMMAKRKEKETQSVPLSVISISPYKSIRSLKRAVKRVKEVLPSSPRKKSMVVCELFPHSSQCSSKKRSDGVNDEMKNKVKDFYRADTVSRVSPKWRDYKIVAHETTKLKVPLQKRLLLFTLKEAYDLFCKEYPEIKIGLSTFCSLRPDEVQLIGSHWQEVCCCPYCENIKFLLREVEDSGHNVNTNSLQAVINFLVCSPRSLSCMKKFDCTECSSRVDDFIEQLTFKVTNTESLEPEDDQGEQQIVICNQWCGGFLEKKQWELTEFKKELSNQIIKIKIHIYNISRQAAELQKQKENLQCGTIIMLTDFAENFFIRHQREVMAAHWITPAVSTSSVTIYTSVIYYRDDIDDELKCRSYAVISDVQKHTSSEVAVFNRKIIDHFSGTTSQAPVRVIIWSDGAAAHFKNRCTMASMTSLDTWHSWNFLESYHGKGPHDVVGATLKREAWKFILAGKAVVKSALDFFDLIENHTKINTLYMSKSEIEQETVLLGEAWKNVSPICGILKSRCIQRCNHNSIALYNTGDENATSTVSFANLSQQESDYKSPDHGENALTVQSDTEILLNVGDWCVVI